jgi:hypothetical protein
MKYIRILAQAPPMSFAPSLKDFFAKTEDLGQRIYLPSDRTLHLLPTPERD